MNQDLTMSSISDDTSPLTQIEIDQRVFDLYDEYCHGRMDRREFLTKSAAVTAGGVAMAQALLPRYARAQTISFTDPRIKARYVSYPSPGGTSGRVRPCHESRSPNCDGMAAMHFHFFSAPSSIETTTSGLNG